MQVLRTRRKGEGTLGCVCPWEFCRHRRKTPYSARRHVHPGKNEVSKFHEPHDGVCNMAIPTDLSNKEMGDIGAFILEDFKEENVLIYASLDDNWKVFIHALPSFRRLS